jgi:hypothetical protein
MALTIFCSPSHIMPEQRRAPVMADDLGGGAKQFRRKWPRPLSSWEFVVPGKQELLEPIIGLLDYAQADSPIWFDGAGFTEVLEPRIVGVGNGTDTDFPLPHRFVLVSSAVIYLSGAANNAWAPLGGDGIVMDQIRFTSAPAAESQITAIYRRKTKCVLVASENLFDRERQFRSSALQGANIHKLHFFLSEVAT